MDNWNKLKNLCSKQIGEKMKVSASEIHLKVDFATCVVALEFFLLFWKATIK